ncbi:MAG: C40 family peptidase [Clostridia bacterium]|nr:C40 family peptidase [Clostridia bacterium]
MRTSLRVTSAYRNYRRKKYTPRKRHGRDASKKVQDFFIHLLVLFTLGIILSNLSDKHLINKKGELPNEKIIQEGYSQMEILDSNSKAALLHRLLVDQLGKPYVYGDEGPYSFDCSGLVQYVFSKVGILLPRVASDQAEAGLEIEKSSLRFGDVVFFSADGMTINHTGIYVGNGFMVHAPKTGEVVKVSRIDSGYYAECFKKAVRLLNY